uniref:Uncharacterized protein n=1 Tax=Anser cygnoides TaxID=8845 RepID=A0A8B9IQT1_ANSCY
MTEINLRLYISIFPRSSTEASVTVEDFMQTTILMRTFYFSYLFWGVYMKIFTAEMHQNRGR